MILRLVDIFSTAALFAICGWIAWAEMPDTIDPDIERHTLRRVIDGDTIVLAPGTTVRLAGVDTPEIDHKTFHHEPGALEAKEFLEDLLHDAFIFTSCKTLDKYGRLIGCLWIRTNREWLLVNREIIRAGHGREAFGYPEECCTEPS